MTEYPILVDGYQDNQGVTIVCESCGTEEQIGPDDLNQNSEWSCKCGGTMVFKYQEADRCPNCQELGFYGDLPTKGCCSRTCMLQMEYAETLKSL